MESKPDQNILLCGEPFEHRPDAKECEYCKKPSSDIYVRRCGTYEYPDEDSYIICGKCILENQIRNNGKFIYEDLPTPHELL